MRRSLGQKRNEISEQQIRDITNIYGEFKENEHTKIFDNEDFGYQKITVERPLKLSFQVLPERIEALHPPKANQYILQSVIKRMAEMEWSGNVRRWYNNTVIFSRLSFAFDFG